MQNIRSLGTIPEKILAKNLRAHKIYFACNAASLPGKPDIIFRRKKIAIFVDSDFWHGHPKRFIMPKTNLEYWRPKIERNIRRDKEVNKILKKDGWIVIRFWEHEVKRNAEKCVQRILKQV